MWAPARYRYLFVCRGVVYLARVFECKASARWVRGKCGNIGLCLEFDQVLLARPSLCVAQKTPDSHLCCKKKLCFAFLRKFLCFHFTFSYFLKSPALQTSIMFGSNPLFQIRRGFHFFPLHTIGSLPWFSWWAQYSDLAFLYWRLWEALCSKLGPSLVSCEIKFFKVAFFPWWIWIEVLWAAWDIGSRCKA